MSNNPFANLPNPEKNPDPRTISISEFQKYQSYEMNKFQANVRSFKKSLPMYGACLALSLFACWVAEKGLRHELFGHDNKGGNYLKLTTIYDEDHYAYNREFQRMQVLGESKLADTSAHSKQLLTDLGVQLPQLGAPKVAKRAPHEKFY